MKIYKVGGAVRDSIIGEKPQDVDYVVVGSNEEELISSGFLRVGKSFPVFLHPETKEEYALARKEIKIGKKHTDFAFDFSSSITLEDDLQRRDFTCNSLAEDLDTGEIIDRFGGINDIKRKILRHIDSEHFIEDPLRVLRMCRFSAQLDFSIAPETMKLAINMVKSGMLEYLSIERIGDEFFKALHSRNFIKFIQTAEECGAFEYIFENISGLLKNGEKKLELYNSLKLAENTDDLLKFGIFFWQSGDTSRITADCKKIKTPKKFEKFAVEFYQYGHYLADNPSAEDYFLFDMIKKTGKFRSYEIVNLIFEGLNYMKYNTKYNKNRCDKIYKLCQIYRVNQLPDFEKIEKDKTIAERYRDFILSKMIE